MVNQLFSDKRFERRFGLRFKKQMRFALWVLALLIALGLALKLGFFQNVLTSETIDDAALDTVSAQTNKRMQNQNSASHTDTTITKSEQKNTGKSSERRTFDRDKFLQNLRSTDVVARNRVLDDFKKYLSTIEESTAELQNLTLFLQEISGKDDVFGPIVAAIGAVGTPSLQGVLRKILSQRPGEWNSFAAIVPVFGGLNSPSDETIQFLEQMTRDTDPDFASTAALALGGSVNSFATAQPERSKQILEKYISNVENPQADPEEIKASLAVLANAGLESTRSAILTLTYHARSDVRAEAVMALRFMRDAEVEQRFVTLFERDPEIDVRLSVVDALAFGPFSSRFMNIFRRCIEGAAKCSLILREKCLDLLTSKEFSRAEKESLRLWAENLLGKDAGESLKSKLPNAIKEFSRP